MGNCSTNDRVERPDEVSKARYSFQHIIGKGGFGKVWKAIDKKTKLTYAIKALNKVKVVFKDSVDAILNERRLLAQMNSPFLVNMNAAFQDKEYLYLVLDLMPGGDLRNYIRNVKALTEEQAKFVIGCVMCGLEYLHTKGIVHRDIKPENLVIDSNGYIRIVDFGIAQVLTKTSTVGTSGTPGYMAPEVIWKHNHGVAVDYFALGVVTYEFMMQKRPYKGKNRKDCQDEISTQEVKLTRTSIPDGWSVQAADFINKCLQRKPANRLGVHGPNEVKQHIWLKDIDWGQLQQRKLKSPLLIDFEAQSSREHMTCYEADLNTEQEKKREKILSDKKIQDGFEGYYYYKSKSGEVTIKKDKIV